MYESDEYESYVDQRWEALSNWNLYAQFCKAIVSVLGIGVKGFDPDYQSFLLLARILWLETGLDEESVEACRHSCITLSDHKAKHFREQTPGYATGRILWTLFATRNRVAEEDTFDWIGEVVGFQLYDIGVPEEMFLEHLRQFEL